MKTIVVYFSFLFLLSCQKTHNTKSFPSKFISSPVIYGNDDRNEISSIKENLLKSLSRAVVSMIPIESDHLRKRPLCQDQPFFDQSREAVCSGVLVGPDLILTAGHCLKNIGQCKNYHWTFDYKINSEDPEMKQEFYKCAYAMRPKGFYKKRNLDFLLVKLDRKVETRRPILLSKDPLEFKVGDEVVAMGNPSGLPLKAMSGKVLAPLNKHHIIKTDIDSFGGNSGAPVFSKKNGSLMGLLISGEKDYELDSLRDCYLNKKCSNENCEGENVLSFEVMKNDIKKAFTRSELVLSDGSYEYSSFKELCESETLNDQMIHTIGVLKEKVRSQNCEYIEKRLKKAKYLDLSSSGIEEAFPLLFFDNLIYFNLENNRIKKLQFLENFKGVKSLFLQGNPLEKMTFLKSLKKIEGLSLTLVKNKEQSFEGLKNLKSLRIDQAHELKKRFSFPDSLEKLEIENSEIEDISFLETMGGLTHLSLKKNKIRDISSLELIPSLRYLDLSFNLIEDLSPLSSLENIYVFKGEENPIKVCLKEKGPLVLRRFCQDSL
jgi:V8-like Glu-specific endopeptidase